ncbi:MAG: hypothetical protein DHS20C15_29530 [Planctomycetota bacterium]|nr:MAG: hypothetical protein DHS20C15_29530 [Planctomycetota bacterium]
MLSRGPEEQSAQPRLRMGWALSCAALLLLAVAIGPALRERAERERLAESDARAVALQLEGLRQRLSRSRGELRSWGGDLLLGRVSAPASRRAAERLLAERAELRALERVDTELVLQEAWPVTRRRVDPGVALPDDLARRAAAHALGSGFPATTPVYDVPGDGPSVTTFVPVLDGTRVLGLVGGSFSLNRLLQGVHAGGDPNTRLELLGADGATLAAVGRVDESSNTAATSLALQPFGLPLSLTLRRERVAPPLLPAVSTGLALFVALALVAYVLRQRLLALSTAPGALLGEASPDALQFVRESPAAVAVFGRDRRCMAVSKRWCAWLALQEDACAGRPFHALVPGEASHWHGVFERGLRGASERREAELLSVVDGRRLCVTWCLEPWTDARGRLGGVTLLLETIAPAVAAKAAPRSSPLPADAVTDELHADARAALRALRRAQAEAALGEHDASEQHAPLAQVAREVSAAHAVITPEAALRADVAYLQRERAAQNGRADPDAPADAVGASSAAKVGSAIDTHADHATAADRVTPDLVLLAEGDDAARDAGARLLREQGLEVLVASNSLETLELFRQRPAETLCVLLALDLPGRDALSTLQDLRRLRADLPVLLVQPPGMASPPRPEERDGCAIVRRPFRAAQVLRACRLAVAARRCAANSYLPTGGAS